MPLMFQKWITPEDLKANPERIYVFGDNVERVGAGGQAKYGRDALNAVGIATKYAPGVDNGDFFSDASRNLLEDAVECINADFNIVKWFLDRGRVVVFPEDGIGTGLSELPTRAPAVHAYILSYMEQLKKRYGVITEGGFQK